MKDLKYLFAYIIPCSGYLALELRGAWSWSTFILAFGIIPIFDALLPVSKQNILPAEEEKLSKKIFFDLLLYACAPLCFMLSFVYFQTLQTQILTNNEMAGLTVSIGIVLGSMGINVAHELGHRSNKTAQFFAKTGLLLVLYQHFFIEHNRGHHKNVGTDADPATARKNENLYAFFVRSIFGQYFGAWSLENKRLEKEKKRKWSWNNAMIRFSVYQCLYLLVVGLWFEPKMVIFAVLIAGVGVLLLEMINYIEHYGLRRAILDLGRPEQVLPKHSWNSDHEVGRVVLFELTRHSDHHYKASRKYQILRHMDESPQLPTGYPASMLMASVPPLWFWVMNQRLEKINKF